MRVTGPNKHGPLHWAVPAVTGQAGILQDALPLPV